MRILFVHNQYQYKGGEDTTLDMEKTLLEQKGHQVKVVLFSNQGIGGGLAGKIKMGIASVYNISSGKEMEKEIRLFQPDVIHVHNLFFRASPSVLYAARKMKVPVVATIHNFRLVCANAMLLRENNVCERCLQQIFPLSGIRYKCYRSSALESALVTGITGIHKILGTWQHTIDRIIVLSEFMKNKLLQSSLRYPEEKFRVKPNFVLDGGEGEKERDDYFLFVGRLSKEKGIDVLLSCFQKMSHARLVIAGDGAETEAVLRSAEKHPSISYIGLQPKEKIMALMKKCRALVFPSIWYEGMPLTIIESFSAGTPVIASRIGAMAEMIEDGSNGFHFSPGNARELEEKLEKFLQMEESARTELYSNARQTYLNKYQPNLHYNSIMEIYHELLPAFTHQPTKE